MPPRSKTRTIDLVASKRPTEELVRPRAPTREAVGRSPTREAVGDRKRRVGGSYVVVNKRKRVIAMPDGTVQLLVGGQLVTVSKAEAQELAGSITRVLDATK
ncbi:MAG: hypothetical protein NT062_05890 [Proteobacteria bacterium]|nr:hypothetical protein [Pseudomonadota bacterium]